MIKIISVLVICVALSACGLKKDLVRPSDIKPDDKKQEQPTQGGYGLL